MAAKQTAMIFFCSDLKKTQAFYSAIGIDWAFGVQVDIGESGLPLSEERTGDIGLPHLSGRLGDLDLRFYLRKDSVEITRNTVIEVQLGTWDEVAEVVKALTETDLLEAGVDAFVSTHQFNPSDPWLRDPDGRSVRLSAPHPIARR